MGMNIGLTTVNRNREEPMKTFSRLFTIFFCVAVMALCGLARAGQDIPTLHVFTWAEYFSPDVLRDFETKHNCRVSLDYYDSDVAMYFKAKYAGGYDVITPAPATATFMRRNGMLRDLDHSLIPNLGNVKKPDPRFTDDPDMTYSVPYTVSVSGVGYNRKKINPADIGSWDIFANPAYAKRMTMLSDMRETLAVAQKMLRYSMNTTDEAEIEKAADLIISWKPNLAVFATEEGKLGLGSGEFLAVHAYSGSIAMVMHENPDIDFYIPREGATVTSDDMVVVADSRQVELAHAFINHILEPAVAAKNMEYIRFYMPNPKALEMIPAEIRDNRAFMVRDEDLDNCEYLRDLGDDNLKYLNAWERIRLQ